MGDAIITYENEILVGKHKGQDYEYVIPKSTILIENPVARRRHYADKHKTGELAKAFVAFLQHARGAALVRQVRLPPGAAERSSTEVGDAVPEAGRPVHDPETSAAGRRCRRRCSTPAPPTTARSRNRAKASCERARACTRAAPTPRAAEHRHESSRLRTERRPVQRGAIAASRVRRAAGRAAAGPLVHAGLAQGLPAFWQRGQLPTSRAARCGSRSGPRS